MGSAEVHIGSFAFISRRNSLAGRQVRTGALAVMAVISCPAGRNAETLEVFPTLFKTFCDSYLYAPPNNEKINNSKLKHFKTEDEDKNMFSIRIKHSLLEDHRDSYYVGNVP